MTSPAYKMLVADSSASFQAWIPQVFTPAMGVRITGQILDGASVLPAIRNDRPDVLLLDLFLPPQDGVALLDEIMRQAPVPVIMFSSVYCPSDSEIFLECYEHGALMVLVKPRTLPEMQVIAQSLRELITRAAGTSSDKLIIDYLETRKHVLGREKAWAARRGVGIISSTGAVEILRDILLKLPPNLPVSVLVAQHMYGPVWTHFVASLASKVLLPVKLAQGGEVVREGVILFIAHG